MSSQHGTFCDDDSRVAMVMRVSVADGGVNKPKSFWRFSAKIFDPALNPDCSLSINQLNMVAQPNDYHHYFI